METTNKQGMTETLVESPLISAESSLEPIQPAFNAGTRLFSGDFAKEAARKSALKRQQIAAENEQARAMVKAMEVAAKVQPTDLYRLNRLALIRSQLADVDAELGEAQKKRSGDIPRLKWLKEWQASLSEQERKLDGRPDPGSIKPRVPKTPKDTPSSYEPVE